MSTVADVHVVPVDGPEHTNTGYTCWCLPHVFRICPECEDNAEARATCWLCEGAGRVPRSNPEMYDGPHGLIVVHNRTAGAPLEKDDE